MDRQMTLRDHLGPRTDATAALHDELDKLLAAPAAVLMEAESAVPSGWHGLPHQSNMDYGPNVALKTRHAIRALATPDSTAALKRVIEKALGMAKKAKELEWKANIDGYDCRTQTSIGVFAITEFDAYPGDKLTVRLSTLDCSYRWFETTEAAKAAAQADYQQRSDAMRQSITADDVLRELGGP